MTYTIEEHFPHTLLSTTEGPCVSIYIPTHRLIQHQAKDKLVFKNLMSTVLSQLDGAYPLREYQDLATALTAVYDDESIWKTNKEGLVVFASFKTMILYKAHRQFLPLAIVASSFHIKPLLAYYQQTESYVILALEADRFAVFIGNGHYLEKVDLSSDIKTTLDEVVGTEHTDNYHTNGSYGGSIVGTQFHGHGGRKEMMELDKEKFFRYVNTIMTDLSAHQYMYPMLVFTHPVNAGLFKRLCTSDHLVEPIIQHSMMNLDQVQILSMLKEVGHRRHDQQLNSQLADLANRADHLVSSSLMDIVPAIYASRVDTLWIVEDKIIPGVIDPLTQRFSPKSLNDVTVDDALDDLVQEAFRHGTRVVMVDPSLMDWKQGIKALYRY